jgi:tetratricopeptide (TPR) repeat protein
VLITSRAPLLDLLPYTTATQRDVTRLSPADGRALLRALGVRGHQSDLDRVVREWDGHALTLSLLGSLLAERYGGDLRRLSDLPAPLADEDRYQRVHRVLRRYDEHLTEAERSFLTLFSLFRSSVKATTFKKAFRINRPVIIRLEVMKNLQGNRDPSRLEINDILCKLSQEAFISMLKQLRAMHLIRYNQENDSYTAHRLIARYYYDKLEEEQHREFIKAHLRLADYYIKTAKVTDNIQTIDDLRSYIEAVHHNCRAGSYKEALRIYIDNISHESHRLLMWKLGAYETALSLTKEFFPDEDLDSEPMLSDPAPKYMILNKAGLCLMALGELKKSRSLYQRALKVASSNQVWRNSAITAENLSELSRQMGELSKALKYGRKASIFAQRADDIQFHRNVIAHQAWVAHLMGNHQLRSRESPQELFAKATEIEQKVSSAPFLYGLRGIWHADYLLRQGHPGKASSLIMSNLRISGNRSMKQDFVRCYRVLGDIAAQEGKHEEAQNLFDEAVKNSHTLSFKPVLVEALIARGRWTARVKLEAPEKQLQTNLQHSFSDLREALALATRSGYRIYEADVRVALAWAHLASGDPARARAEAERARAMSEAMGYHWGQVDAAEVLEGLET